MRRLFFPWVFVLILFTVAQSQVNTQNARRTPTGSGVPGSGGSAPPLACVLGPPFGADYTDISTTPPTIYKCKAGSLTPVAGGSTSVPSTRNINTTSPVTGGGNLSVDRTIACATCEVTGNKDASGGYPGLTLFKINFNNTVNTFRSFFINANTAARNYTFQDRNGTIADDTDLALKAPLVSPAFTSTPTTPTPAVDANTTQVVNAAFVLNQAASVNPIIDGTAAPGTSTRYARADHVHPTDTSRAPTVSPTFTGTPIAPTQSQADNSTKLATTAYVDTLGATKLATNGSPSALVIASQATGDLLQASSATAWARLPDVATGQVLRSGGVGAVAAWGTLTAGDMGTTLTPQFAGVGIGRSASGPFYVLAPAATNLRMFFEAPAGQQVQFHGLITGTQDTVWGVDSSGNFNISTADDNFGAGKRFSLNASSGAAIFFNSLAIGNGTAILKHLSATSTLDFANLAAIGCEDLTITVTGAALGDSVALGIPNGSVVANGTFTGWVSAADTVTVRFCTVVSGNPASGTFRADVWQH